MSPFLFGLLGLIARGASRKKSRRNCVCLDRLHGGVNHFLPHLPNHHEGWVVVFEIQHGRKTKSQFLRALIRKSSFRRWLGPHVSHHK